MRPRPAVGPESSPAAPPRPSVVAEEPAGEPVAPEQRSEAPLDGLTALVALAVDAEQEPAVVVEHGKGEAAGPIAEEEVALVVHLPEVVGRSGLEARHRAAWLGPGAQAPVAAQDGRDCSGPRGLDALMEKAGVDLPSAPGRVAVADPQHGPFDIGGRPVRAAVGLAGAVAQRIGAARAVTSDPLVGGQSG